MKKLRILFAASLVFPMALIANFNQNAYNGKNGQLGENGENGENGGFYGGNGGNGGSGGNGGNGGRGGFFGGNGGNGGDGGKGESKKNLSANMASEKIDEYEYKALKDACRMVITKVEERLTETGNLNPFFAQQIFKSELSSYLLSLKTPASQKIYAEYEAVGWKYPDIKDI